MSAHRRKVSDGHFPRREPTFHPLAGEHAQRMVSRRGGETEITGLRATDVEGGASPFAEFPDAPTEADTL
jgi:hypothetical protein